ncbi:hypothetical protein QCA50_006294 [Cerrena zonata]|uniref:Uncharacterized protein n=1 Tax=Cerrena zonata TaxID=2478898 RepID=A0AAW0GCV3_9APHY
MTFEAGIAPRLLAANGVCGRFMVIMDDISDTYTPLLDKLAWAYLISREYCISEPGNMPGNGTIHDPGPVHGDVRDVNTLMENSDASKDLPLIQIVD